MSLARATLPEFDRRFIIGRSAGCCNKCREPVFLENEFGEKARIGDDAHIWAYSDGGPRGAAPGAPKDRNERNNIILLCRNCHSEVDQQPLKFTPQVLTEMRETHYTWVASCLGQTEVDKPRFHYLIYLNLPRLDMFAVANSIALPAIHVGDAQRFADMGINAGRVMAAYTRILNADDLYAHALDAKKDISVLQVGQFCFVEPTNFRTRGVDDDCDLHAAWAAGRSVVYRRFADWTLICLIDPRWVTTSTAGVILRGGQARLCGVIRINRVDRQSRNIYASPLFLAQ